MKSSNRSSTGLSFNMTQPCQYSKGSVLIGKKACNFSTPSFNVIFQFNFALVSPYALIKGQMQSLPYFLQRRMYGISYLMFFTYLYQMSVIFQSLFQKPTDNAPWSHGKAWQLYGELSGQHLSPVIQNARAAQGFVLAENCLSFLIVIISRWFFQTK